RSGRELPPEVSEWSVLTAEPGGVDYVETNLGDKTVLWVQPKNGGQRSGHALPARRWLCWRIDLDPSQDGRTARQGDWLLRSARHLRLRVPEQVPAPNRTDRESVRVAGPAGYRAEAHSRCRRFRWRRPCSILPRCISRIG